jgi:hypothetical protein
MKFLKTGKCMPIWATCTGRENGTGCAAQILFWLENGVEARAGENGAFTL